VTKLPSVVFDFWELDECKVYMELAERVIDKCFEIETLYDKNVYINVVFTVPEKIREINKQYRDVDKETDVLSFPMFEREEIEALEAGKEPDTLGDIVISIEQVKKQAVEYGHSFERELAYMLVHGFYHLMGYDHMVDEEKVVMRAKEEFVLSELEIGRE